MNAAEEAVAEELLHNKELFTSAVPGQDHKTAATSSFRVYSSWSILIAMMISSTNKINFKTNVSNSIAKATN